MEVCSADHHLYAGLAGAFQVASPVVAASCLAVAASLEEGVLQVVAACLVASQVVAASCLEVAAYLKKIKKITLPKLECYKRSA